MRIVVEGETFIKGLGFCGVEPLAGSNAAAADVWDDAGIIRSKSIHYIFG